MNRVYDRSYRRLLQQNMEMLVFGNQGIPVLVFPTAKGGFFEFEDRGMLDGYYDDDCCRTNPIEYLPTFSNESILNLYQKKIRFILAAGKWDFSLDENLALSRIFDSKGIRHWLDVWGDHTKHDWPWWQMMLRKFLT
jgi:esterase/lipase superfamily enzyme